MKYPHDMELAILANDDGQFMLIAPHGWGNPKPTFLNVFVVDDGMNIVGPNGVLLGKIKNSKIFRDLPFVYLGEIQDGKIVDVGEASIID